MVAAVTKNHKSGGFRTAEMYSLPDLEARNQGVGRTCFLSQLLVLPAILGLKAASLQSLPLSSRGRLPCACLSLCLFPSSYKEKNHTGLRACPPRG